MRYIESYKMWCDRVTDPELSFELAGIAGNEAAIEDAFYCDLEFGTAGLRGIMSAGTNKINIYTVAKASQGIANYLKEISDTSSIAIGYDSRIKSDLFSKVAASVFAANEIKVHLWPQLMPVPALSYAVRCLGADAGIVITASHNPSNYNGYKVYGGDGCQITGEVVDAISNEIEKIDIFEDICNGDFDTFIASGMIEYIDANVYTEFIEAVKKQSVLFGEKTDKNVAIVYSPLNGAGLGPVTRALKEAGYGKKLVLVKEQEQPDGNFPTCPYPNPEVKEAMKLGIDYANRCGVGLLLATDPDCDRIGIAVKDNKGEFLLLTGNQIGILFFDYICSQRKKHNKMHKNPLFVKTIVTTDLCEKIAYKYGIEVKNVLTGFKYIGEAIGHLEFNGCEKSYIFGFEESYGYLSGTYVRDKDAVNGAFLICEMFCYYQSKGISLVDRLNKIYDEHGYSLNAVYSYTFEGAAGFNKRQEIMNNWRKMGSGYLVNDVELGGLKVVDFIDYEEEINGLPKANIIKILLENDCSVFIRPSGTEPKIKAYISIVSDNNNLAEINKSAILNDINSLMK